MESDNTSKSTLARAIPPIGIACFIILYWYASTLYPGGSQEDLKSIGYDWVHNYWCNLMNEQGMNGMVNPARPYAISAMMILCASLLVFFLHFAYAFCQSQLAKKAVAIGGVLSMGFACLIFTNQHDLMTMVSSFFGLFVVIGIIKELWLSKLRFYKLTGFGCLLLLLLNNYIYYTEQFLGYLPIIQKITMLMILLWIIGLNNNISNDRNSTSKISMF